jgi:hypothetical protein
MQSRRELCRAGRARRAGVLLAAGSALVLAGAGCGAAHSSAPTRSAAARGRQAALAALVREARPIGRGPGFTPPARGKVIGRCSDRLGPRDGVHVEVFAADRVVIVAAGIGTRGRRSYSAGRITGAACYGGLVTVEPTGVVLLRPGARLMLGALFRSWGQPLSTRRLAGFAASPRTRVAVFVDGRVWRGAPAAVPLRRHAEIVLEVGPHVPPHRSYTFPPGE